MKKFKLKIDEPIMLAQGASGDQIWGHTQFPNIGYTLDGKILATWNYGNDEIDYDYVLRGAVSEDGGKTWKPSTNEEWPGHKMSNGKYFKGFRIKGAHKVDYLDKYTPGFANERISLYFAEDVDAPEDTEIWGLEFDPATGETTEFKAAVNWPYQPLPVWTTKDFPGYAYPATMIFALTARHGIIELDGSLYYTLYFEGFDAEAKTREEAVDKYCGFSNIFVFRSDDFGHTWNYLSQIRLNDDILAENPKRGCRFEGLDEPMMAQVPDGSVVMLIRTGSDNPSYISRSTDNCKTWSKPVMFDDTGVLPQILALDCGVTLASYGRPSVKVRATEDPSAMKWDDPVLLIDCEATRKATSCCYTKMVAVDSHTALLVYSDFATPHPDGGIAKAIMMRKITVEEV